MAKLPILENLQREDPHSMEEAEGFERQMLTHGCSVGEDEVSKLREWSTRLHLVVARTQQNSHETGNCTIRKHQ